MLKLKNKYTITALTSAFVVLVFFIFLRVISKDYSAKTIRAGFIYIGDTSTAYTYNFYIAQKELEESFDDKISTVAKFNVQENQEEVIKAVNDLVEQKCDIIFSTSYGYEEFLKPLAQKYSHVQFCQATGIQANQEPVLANFHNFMGIIYEGRYISGIVAGLKLKELVETKQITPAQEKIGYVAAFPYAEVISGYTAFFLGVRSVMPDAIMSVIYTQTWDNYFIEKDCADRLIDQGCVIISQHSDTTGPAIACEEASMNRKKIVYHVGYNQSMIDVAPTSSLVSSRINWSPYIISACQALLKEKKVESVVKGTVYGNDVGAGIHNGWVEIIGLNELILPPETEEKIEAAKKQFKNGNLNVFRGNYIGVNPFDPSDFWNLNIPFIENQSGSAPSFNYVLKDVITIEE